MNKIFNGTSHQVKNLKDHAIPHTDHPNCFCNVSEYSWADAFYHKSKQKFLEILHPSVTQTASTSPYVFYGNDEVANTFSWASQFYLRCDFLYQASIESIDFIEWEVTTNNNMYMTGMTVLIKNEDEKIVKVFNGHRNLLEAILFSEHFVKGPKDIGIVSLFHNKAIKKYGLENRFMRNPAGFNAVSSVDEPLYINAFRDGSRQSFKDICAANVLLSSSYVARTVVGIENVSECLELMAGFYEHCTFTAQANYKNRIYLLYNGRLRNGFNVSDGFLILVRDVNNKITEILDNPIPLNAGTLISAYLKLHFSNQTFSGQHFYDEDLFSTSVKTYTLDNVYGKQTKDLSSFKGFLAKFFIDV